MAQEKKYDLKIRVSVSTKERIRRDSKRCGFTTMSKYALACIDAAPWVAHVETSQDIMRTFQKLAEFEKNGASLPKKERRALATRIRNRLIDLCRDEAES